MSKAVETSSKKLATALDYCRKRTQGLSDQALNAAAAASIALGQNGGNSYPAEYVRKRVGLLLTELEHLAGISAELGEKQSALASLVGAFGGRAFASPAHAHKEIDALLRDYCIARGSGAEWKRSASSSDGVRRAG